MMKDKYFKFLIVGIILILSIFFDQWSKFWAEDNLATPRYPDHVVTLNVEETAQPMTFEALISARYPKNSEKENKYIVANGTRDGKRLMPQDEVKAGDEIQLGYVSLTVIDGYYDYQYARNPGAAFSFLANQPEKFRSIFFGITGILAVILILVFIGFSSWKKQKPLILALACVLGGAFGNIIDRVRLSYVIDFVSWHIGDKYYWPTFNVADVFVTCGVIFLIIDLLIHREPKKNESEDESSEKNAGQIADGDKGEASEVNADESSEKNAGQIADGDKGEASEVKAAEPLDAKADEREDASSGESAK
ncbi:MAG: signal peptidase II [Proteobacteria bacterium]|nr:signal peptidase II [Pseudomonadota bacterium]